jgi:hypothetical protein
MSFSTTFSLEKPSYQTLRYDTPLNTNFDILEAGLKCWPSGSEPGNPANFDAIVLTEGVLWRDTTNHKFKTRGASAWETVWTDTGAQILNNTTAPSTPADNTFVHYAEDVSSVSCPKWKLQDGSIILLCKQAHVADINAQAVATLTNAYGTADGTLEDVGATNSGDVSGAIKNNFKECTTEIANLKTVVDDLRTKFNTILSRLETLGLHATS